MTVSGPLARRLIAPVWRRRAIAVPVALAAVLTGSASGISLVRIHPGDTLSAIAVRYHTTVARLVALNHLPGDGDLIYAGQDLKIPSGGGSSGARTVYHVVVPGDTLDGIAARYHVNPMAIARRNHLPRSLIVVLGSRLAIPLQGSQNRPSSALGSLADRPEPSRDGVASLIRSTSARWGLDPSLALAVSWQESGWNMREVSPVGAIGAMQVMPATGAFISTDVVHRRLDLGDAGDNVTAGVALLSMLTHEASSTSQAVAGYYQGLQSVIDHGMYPSTKQYVADVMSLRQTYR